MITVKCSTCRDWSLSAPSGIGLLQALREHQKTCVAQMRAFFYTQKQKDERDE